jgi:hypothetical protein
MGEFSRVLGIRPWESGLLTVDEFKALVVYIRTQAEADRGA